MASQVLSGSSDVSYTNNTGQNVRIIINYMTSRSVAGSNTLNLNWAGVTVGNAATGQTFTIGKNLASHVYGGSLATNQNNSSTSGTLTLSFSYPTEIMLASTQSFTAVCGAYNIIVIPEAG